MIRLFRLYQDGHLPDAGGAISQPVIMMEVFADMDAFEQRLRAPNADPLTPDGEIDYKEKGRRAQQSWFEGAR